MQIVIDLARLRRILTCTLILLISAGFWAEANDSTAHGVDRSEWISFLSLSWEYNLPTWYSSLALFTCSALLMMNALRGRSAGEPHNRNWWVLSAIFLYMSLDEFVQLHENANDWFDLGGIFYFGWVIPAAAVVFAVGAYSLRFLLALPRRTARLFVTAGCLYVGGALGVELVLGYWTDTEGRDNVVYALIDLVEESMEMIGASVFLYALVDRLAGSGEGLRVEFRPQAAVPTVLRETRAPEGAWRGTNTARPG